MSAEAPSRAPGGAAPRRPRKWVAARIDELDPETDYVEIVRLTTLYGSNDLQMHWFYTVGTAVAAISPTVLAAVYRDGAGKYVTAPTKRKDDSNDHMMLWFEHGPHAPATEQSVAMVNSYHAHFAKSFPDAFADPEDYIYILCANATLVHTAMRRLGLPGMSEKQKRAAFLFWSELATRFTMPDGTVVTTLQAFPDSFEAMEHLVADYMARPWPVHEGGHRSTSSAIEHFAETWFPRPMRFFGRALVTSFLPEEVMRAHDIKAAPAPLTWASRRVMKTLMLLGTHVLPDPTDSLPDARRRAAASGSSKPSVVDTAVHRRLQAGQATQAPGSVASQGEAPVIGCPHLAVAPRPTPPGR